jgi:hypothetical protein
MPKLSTRKFSAWKKKKISGGIVNILGAGSIAYSE